MSGIEPIPSLSEITRLHSKADTDGDEGSLHHTLGPRKGQASPGDHDHLGGNSKLLFEGYIITGQTPGEVADSLMAMLVEFGAEDGRT